MRKIPLWLFIFVFTASLARAQDDATQQQIDKLTGQVQDLIDAQAAQGKRIEKLSKIEHDLIKQVHPQVNEIKEGMEEMIAVVKENSEINSPAAKKKGH